MQKLLNTLNKFKPASIKVARYRNFQKYFLVMSMFKLSFPLMTTVCNAILLYNVRKQSQESACTNWLIILFV